LKLAERAESLNPGFYQNALLQGRALVALNRREEAAKAFGAALQQRPAFASERREIEKLLDQSRPHSK
jgi:hypothetical protein